MTRGNSLTPTKLLCAWALLLFLAACMLLGATQLGIKIVEISRAWLWPELTLVAQARSSEVPQPHEWVRGIPGAERLPSVQYVSESEVVVRLEQVVHGQPMVCTMYLDARGRRSSVAC